MTTRTTLIAAGTLLLALGFSTDLRAQDDTTTRRGHSRAQKERAQDAAPSKAERKAHKAHKANKAHKAHQAHQAHQAKAAKKGQQAEHKKTLKQKPKAKLSKLRKMPPGMKARLKAAKKSGAHAGRRPGGRQAQRGSSQGRRSGGKVAPRGRMGRDEAGRGTREVKAPRRAQKRGAGRTSRTRRV
jgi:hypothetical protein